MSYSRVRLNITKADFPLLTEFAGRTVLAPAREEAGNAVEKNVVGLLYCENVMPTKEGLKSVDFLQAIPALVVADGSYLSLIQFTYDELAAFTYAELADVVLPLPYSQWGLNFVRILEVRGAGQIRAYIAITAIGTLFISTPSTTTWTVLNNEGWNPTLTDINNVSIATVLTGETAETLICLSKFKLLKVDIVGKILRPVTFVAGSNIVQSEIVGIVASYNYLILHDGNNLQWSSAFNPLDFNLANALVSGTGFGTPIGLQGKITALVTNPAGFTVYSDVNAIDVDWSGNARFPWVFRPIPNSAGVPNMRYVVVGENNINVAWTNQGLQSITAQNAEPVFPEVTDFLTFGKLETYNYTTNEILVTQGKLRVDIGYAGARYVIISYGVEEAIEFTQALIFDIALERWGKVLIPHVDTVDYRIGSFNTPRSGIGFLASDGQVSVIDFSDRLCSMTILNAQNFIINSCTPGMWDGTVTMFETNAAAFNISGTSNPVRPNPFTTLEIFISFFVNVTVDFLITANCGAETANATVTANVTPGGDDQIITLVFPTALTVDNQLNILGEFLAVAISSHDPLLRITKILAS